MNKLPYEPKTDFGQQVIISMNEMLFHHNAYKSLESYKLTQAQNAISSMNPKVVEAATLAVQWHLTAVEPEFFGITS